MSTASVLSEEQRQEKIKALEPVYEQAGIHGFWQLGRRPPEPQVEARVWRWKEIYPAIVAAAEVIRIPEDAFRRANPLMNVSKTMAMGFQIVNPGETEPAHRHTPTALRFVVQGSGAFTTSNGERMLMEPGDLITQPNWAWHDHSNFTGEKIIWLDCLDSKLVSFLDASFHEDWAEGVTQPIVRPDGDSLRKFGQVRPPAPVGTHQYEPVPYQYKWKDTLPVLEGLAEQEGDPYDGVLLEYTHPVTGGHTFLTISCRIQMLRPGEATRTHRHTGTTIYHVFQGNGVTTVDKTDPLEMTWGDKDCFLVPPWRWHSHRNLSKSEPAIMFSESDLPVFEALGLYREERG